MLIHHHYYNPKPAQDMWAFGLLLLEWLGIKKPPAHERAWRKAYKVEDLHKRAHLTQQYAAALATQGPAKRPFYNRQVSSYHLSLSPPACAHKQTASTVQLLDLAGMLAAMLLLASSLCSALMAILLT